ncbi:MAG: hypothetical protein V1674_04415 [Candidatus Omnitrophota bacterium]
MNKNIAKIIVPISVVVIVIFLFGCNNNKAKSIKSKTIELSKEAAVEQDRKEARESTSSVKGIGTPAAKKEKTEGGWKRDPFIILEKDLADIEKQFSYKTVTKRPELSQLKLTGIIFAKENSPENSAMISGELMKVGDQVVGFKIVDIKSNSVVLKWENQEFVLQLWEEGSK